MIGCRDRCVGSSPGPGCEDVFPAARLAIHHPSAWAGTLSPWSDAAVTVTGTRAQGASWAPAAVNGDLLLGMPDDEAVVVVDDPSGQQSATAAQAWTSSDAEFGASIALSDVTGGYWHLWVGAPGADLDRGAVYVFRDAGRHGGRSSDDADVSFGGLAPGDRLGERVVVCGDLDDDGRADLAVTAPRLSSPSDGILADQGVPRLAGGVLLLRSDAVRHAVGEVDATDLGPVFWGDDAGDAAGTDVTCERDVTGDGVADLVVGAPYAGASDAGEVVVVAGGADLVSRLADAPNGGPLASFASREIAGPADDAWAGTAVAAGDLDGDGLPELVVGVPGASSGHGEALLYYGSDLAIASADVASRTTFAAPSGRATADHVGTSLLTADLDGDGRDDLVVGSPDWKEGTAWGAGQASVWLGANFADWRASEEVTVDDDAVVQGTISFQRVGRGMAAADLDGDGRSDLLLPTRLRSTQ